LNILSPYWSSQTLSYCRFSVSSCDSLIYKRCSNSYYYISTCQNIWSFIWKRM